MEKVPFTKSGLANLKSELNSLKKTQRPDIIKAIQIAREHGDLSENAEYEKVNSILHIPRQISYIDMAKCGKCRI